MSATHKHFGIIPDGARRWSTREGQGLAEGYCYCVSRILELADMAYHAGYQEVSIYCLSLANLERSASEVRAVFDTMRTSLHLFEALIGGDTFQRIRVVGETDRLPGDVRERLERLEALGCDSAVPTINLLIAYDAATELERAHQRAYGEQLALSHFDVTTPVQVIFRSGKGVLLSGFLPFQSQYAHLVVSDKLFNDLTEDDMREVFEESEQLDHWFGR
jgi:undecaprenyl diphosphate synthase